MGLNTFPFAPNPPAPGGSVSALLEATSAKPLPNEHLEFLLRANGGEGFIGENYVILWRAEELLYFNRDYQTAELAPALFLTGSNGGGDAYAFDRRSNHSAVSAVPFIGMAYQYIERVADSFSSFVMPRE